MASREDVPHDVTQHSASRRGRRFKKKKKRARLYARVSRLNEFVATVRGKIPYPARRFEKRPRVVFLVPVTRWKIPHESGFATVTRASP